MLSWFRLLFVAVRTNANKKPTTPKAILAPKALWRATLRYVINFSLHLLSAWYLRLEDNNRGKYFTYRLSLMLERCVISQHGRCVSAFYAPRLCCGTSRHVLSCVARMLESNRPLRWGRVFVSAREYNSFPCSCHHPAVSVSHVPSGWMLWS